MSYTDLPAPQKWTLRTKLDFQCAACRGIGVEQRFMVLAEFGVVGITARVLAVEVECLSCSALVKYDPGTFEVEQVQMPVPPL